MTFDLPRSQRRPRSIFAQVYQFLNLRRADAHHLVSTAPIDLDRAVILWDRATGEHHVAYVAGNFPRVFRLQNPIVGYADHRCRVCQIVQGHAQSVSTGTLRISNAPAPNESLTLSYDEPPRDSSTPRVHYDYHTTTDEKGHFAFEKVVPGNGQVMRNVVVDMGRGMSQWIPTHVTKTTFVAGETAQVQLGRSGRPVVGKLVMPDGLNEYDWRHAMASLQVVANPKVKPPTMPIPKDIDPKKDRDAAMKWWEEWKDTKEGQQYSKDIQRYQAALRAVQPVSYSTNIEPTGIFTFDDLPTGDYQLTVHAQAEPKDGQMHPGQAVASLSHTFKIPEIPGGHSEESLDLGTLTLKAIQRPNVGQ